MKFQHKTLLLLSGALLLTGCTEPTASWNREAGSYIDEGDFGGPSRNNELVQSGQINYSISLNQRFSNEVPPMVNFEFNQSVLDAQAQQILLKQADWIRQFPEVRFRVYGYTDLVGSVGYNKALGMRRAQAVVGFLVSHGISRSRLEAVVSYGKTQPLIVTDAPERRNRRAVTEVSGFVGRHPTVLNGKYAEIIHREYIASAVPSSEVGQAATTGEGVSGGNGGGGGG